jgi:hypothetical protein
MDISGSRSEYARCSYHSRPFLGVATGACVDMNGKSLTNVLGGLWTRSRLRAGSWGVLQREANGIIEAGSLDPVVRRGQYSVFGEAHPSS